MIIAENWLSAPCRIFFSKIQEKRDPQVNIYADAYTDADADTKL